MRPPGLRPGRAPRHRGPQNIHIRDAEVLAFAATRSTDKGERPDPFAAVSCGSLTGRQRSRSRWFAWTHRAGRGERSEPSERLRLAPDRDPAPQAAAWRRKIPDPLRNLRDQAVAVRGDGQHLFNIP